jgi:alpha-ketoglutarate-dependent taurine dioxygenase
MEQIKNQFIKEPDAPSPHSSDPLSGHALFADQTSPILISATQENTGLKSYITEKKSEVQATLLKYGAILFRGFSIDSVAAFDAITACFSNQPIPYMFRSSPRYSLSERVYVSTTYPENRMINMHSESSYSFAWGQKIIFCCIKAPKERGETPIADNRKVLNSLSKELRDKFEKKGVIYHRNLTPEIGIPWEEVFQTSDKGQVKDMCKQNNIQFEFKTDDNLVLRWRKPAIYKHPITGEKIWFNHAFFFNRYSLLDDMGFSFNDTSIDDFLPSDTFFGDGSPISHSEYQEIKQSYETHIVKFPWQIGDVLLLDNMLTSHGRSPYKGERQIIVSIVEPVSDRELNCLKTIPD